ncbi:aspartate/glutamate racemase family protein [Limnochorda pilosa]|uniref:Hydantoin racemase n=1 Tax=Limnochorda pilosa TaxID=1555112 RepID=A0A0K2SM16_LIMPI|nr:aspartate/glutamate racemase family protein [Limnochorda pilosa]BAS28151.1 hydantoin racemase [Limnochorda pilosa]
MIGLIRVLTLEDPELLNRHGRLLEARYGLPVESRCIPDQPRGIYDEATEAAAVPKIVETARQLEAGGARAIFISCAADPALEEVREAVSVPVVGAGSAGAALALALGGRIGLLSITEAVPGAIERILGPRVVALERPTGVTDATHLLEPGAVERSLEAARRLVQQGAGTILLACTGFANLSMATRIQADLGVPAVDPVWAGGLMLSYVLKEESRCG